MSETKNKSVFIPKSFIDETLAVSPVSGKHSLEPFKSFAKENKVPLEVIEDTNVINGAELHRNMADLWFCLRGSAVFTVGGELVNGSAKVLSDGKIDDNEWKAPSISGGKEIVLKEGDWLWIPAGEPHSHRAEKTARLAIIKVPLKN